MTQDTKGPRGPSRRTFLSQAALAAAAVPLSTAAAVQAAPALTKTSTEPFWGKHQGGITTPMQRHTYFMVLDLSTTKRQELIQLLQSWTAAAAKMTAGQDLLDPEQDPTDTPDDSGEALGLAPSRLTITFGFGPGLFLKDGVDRFGLAKERPEALQDLPRFVGDKLVPERTGGDLSIQACADDPQVAYHAVRQLARLAYSVAKVRWAQSGFIPDHKGPGSPRNLMGFKDGSLNVDVNDPKALKQFVWAGEEAPAWFRNGSYMVVRPIRISLEHWDQMKLAFQEQTMGRHKLSGAPIGKKREDDPLDLTGVDKDGIPLIAENAHVRLASPQANDGAQILRRGYSYENGVNFTIERWPPWKQAMEFDAGLLFQCYQRDPRTGFNKIFENMAKFDMLNQFVTHVGSGLFACPPGAQPGEFIGQRLFG